MHSLVPVGTYVMWNKYTVTPACNIRTIDSMNFLPVALSELPKMFDLKELAKGYFPHLFNKRTNQGIVTSHLPGIQYYNPDSMTTDPTKASNRRSFLE